MTITLVYAFIALYYNFLIVVITKTSSFLVTLAITSYISTIIAINSTILSVFTSRVARLSRDLGYVLAIIAIIGTLSILIYI